MNVLADLQARFGEALSGLAPDLLPDPAPYAAMVKPSQDARHGDYQANAAMPLAKVLGKPPREVAAEIVRRLPLGDLLEPPEIAGPGFINLRLRSDWIASQIHRAVGDVRLGVAVVAAPRTIVIDYSSPNVAKPMHVGHLRSTIIGDSITRILRFLGHRVITDNHLGDWGTQFGMLIYGYKHHRDTTALEADPVREMVRLYVLVRNLSKAADDEADAEGVKKYSPEEVEAARTVAEACRLETAKLHAGDPENLALWRKFMPWCLAEIDRVYRKLGILPFDYTLGESYYNPELPDVVADLERKGIARSSEGAVAIFFGKDDPPAVIRKKDGAFTYTTTDLATLRHRVEKWKADAILYVVDFRQALHFKNLFDAARRWGYDRVHLEHVSFGSMLGMDGKPLSTRAGGATELDALLAEAYVEGERAFNQLQKDRREMGREVLELTPEERRRIVEVVSVGAVKYADLSQNRTSDYKFDVKKMTELKGNTATYMQYAYVRVRGIFREAELDAEQFRQSPPDIVLSRPAERQLALQLVRFDETLAAAAAELKPNAITAYLWDLAKALSTFYDSCNVLKAETPALRQSRLALCDLTGRTIQKGLDLLGIETVERM
jgi:arginyl-tRNA synthetase